MTNDLTPSDTIEVVEVSPDTAAVALAALDADEAARGSSLVDEAEHLRLRRFVGTGDRVAGWQAVVGLDPNGTGVLGYGGLVAAGPGERTFADVAVFVDADAGASARGLVLRRLLSEGGARADAVGLSDVQVWIRQVGDVEIDTAASVGFSVERRLGVLGRHLDDVEVVAPGDGWAIRAYRPDADDEAVVAALAAAYAGTDEGGWTLAQFRERRGYDWFDPADLLLVEDGAGRIAGLHWLKRRSSDRGEVYNLAIDPTAQGAGLGAALLTAGLAHLRDLGCLDVMLWVDRANDRAVRLYEKYGFTTRWDDVAFRRTRATV